MPRDHRLYLDDILGGIDRIRTYIEGMDYPRFLSDQKTMDAVVQTKLESLEAACRALLADDSKGTGNNTPER